MTRIITIPNDNRPLLNHERDRIVPWAEDHGWIYVGYNDARNHIDEISRLNAGRQIEIIDCNCDGTPILFDHTPITQAVQWGQALKGVLGFLPQTVIYLDACNTALRYKFGGPIAQAVAIGAGCTVYGTKGYMKGTYAEGTEICRASPGGALAYPGGQDADSRGVWKAFSPQVHLADISMSQQKSLNIKREEPRTRELSSAIEKIMESAPVDFPDYRMAPDITINYQHKGKVMILDVYANGSLLQDRVTNRVWRVNNPEQLLDSLANLL